MDCQYGIAAELCNDVSPPKFLFDLRLTEESQNDRPLCVDCWTIGYFVNAILGQCESKESPSWITGGQVFAGAGHWNVVLRADSCGHNNHDSNRKRGDIPQPRGSDDTAASQALEARQENFVSQMPL